MTEHHRTHRLPARDLRIVYLGVERHARDSVAAVLDPLLWIVPPWCRSISVRVTQQKGGGMASVCVDEEYRQASIQLDGEWFNAPPEEQRRYLAHELVHILIQPMADLGRRLLDALSDDLNGPAFKLIDAQWVAAVEAVTSDIDRTIAARLEDRP